MSQGKLLWTYYDRELRYIRRLAGDQTPPRRVEVPVSLIVR